MTNSGVDSKDREEWTEKSEYIFQAKLKDIADELNVRCRKKGKKWKLYPDLKLEQLSEPLAEMWTPAVRRGFSGEKVFWYAWMMPKQFQEKMAHIRWKYMKLSFL